MSRKLWIRGRSSLVSISRICLKGKRQTENVAWRLLSYLDGGIYALISRYWIGDLNVPRNG
jgi:hypothetical protein